MPEVRNTTGRSLTLMDTTIPAGSVASISGDALATHDARALINAGSLIVHHAPKSEPIDIDALRDLADGDGRTTEVREARDTLESLGETW